MRCVREFFVRLPACAALFLVGCAARPLDGPGDSPATDLGRSTAVDLATARDAAAPPDLALPAGYPAPHAPLPQEVDSGGPRLVHPAITVVSYPGDDFAADVEALVASLPGSSYWEETTVEYGVGALTARPPIRLAEAAPARLSNEEIAAWLVARLDGSHPDFGLPDPDSLFVILYPSSTSIDAGGARSCVDFGGYHDAAPLPGGGFVAYAVLPRCETPYVGLDRLQSLTVAVSHEIIEAATDAAPLEQPAWARPDAANVAWGEVLGGVEVADLCALDPDWAVVPPGLAYSVQRSWSNAAAREGRDPCVPSPPGQPYFNAAPVLPDEIVLPDGPAPNALSRGVALQEGQSKTIELRLFSDGPTAPWRLSTVRSPYSAGVLDLRFDRSSGRNGDLVHLTIKVVAPDPSGIDGFLVVSTLGDVERLWPIAVAER